MSPEHLVATAGTRLFVEARGDPAALPMFVLHGGPGLDHWSFGDYLDPLAERGHCRLLLVDERGQGRSARDVDPATLTLEQMAADVSGLAESLSLERYAVFGHSFGSFVALQHAVDRPGAAAGTIVSGGVASARWLGGVAAALEQFEPPELREQVSDSWAREASVTTEGEVAQLWADQAPFHFADPRDPRIGEYLARTAPARYAPEVLARFAAAQYGGIEVEDRLGTVSQPVLVLSGRHDRTCPPEAGAEMASRLPRARHVVFEHSGHLFFVEEQEAFLAEVGAFCDAIRS